MDNEADTKNDIVIGAAVGYDWENIEAWAMSLITSGFEGIRALVLYDGNEQNDIIADFLKSNGFRIFRIPLDEGVHNGRFADISQVLNELAESARYAVVTDVRDVYFQSDPIAWLKSNLTKPLLAGSEGVRYSDEQWNRDNLWNGFPAHADRILPKTVCNVGVIAGEVQAVADVCLAISMFAKSSGFWMADQSAYNLLLDMEPYRSTTQIALSEDGFGCHAGTMADSSNVPPSILLEPPPILDSEGVKTTSGKLYPIVHQYDRVPEWDQMLRGRLAPRIRRIYLAYLESTVRTDIQPPSGGFTHRRRRAGSGNPMVSVICPTYQRSTFLREAVRNFSDQTYSGELEMVILDDSPEPSADLADPRYVEMGIRYYHMPLKRFSLGTKINLLTQLARGEIIVQFDDDDYYAPSYTARMLEYLGDADFLTLSGWFTYSPDQRTLCYWEADVLSPNQFVLSPSEPLKSISTDGWDPDLFTRNLWGYSFSYVWRKSVSSAVEIPDIPSEGIFYDYDFYSRVESAGFKTVLAPDTEGIVLHIVHPQSSVVQVPQWILPEFLVQTLFPGYRAVEAGVTARLE